MHLDGAVVLITGASEGIGQACVEAFRNRGAKLSLAGLPSAVFQNTQHGDLVTPGDLTDPAVPADLVARTLERFGRIDVLVNNAGVGLYAPPSSVPLELAKRMFALNVFAAAAMAQAVIPSMRTQRSGTIVNVGSVGGYVSLPWAVMYCASKFALHAYSDSLRRELRGSGVRVLKVCPGIVDTEFRKHVLSGAAPREVENIDRLVTPRQVAESLVRGVERNARNVYVPWIGKLFTTLELVSPRLMDWYLARKWNPTETRLPAHDISEFEHRKTSAALRAAIEATTDHRTLDIQEAPAVLEREASEARRLARSPR